MGKFVIIRQRNFSPMETRIVTKYALLNDIPVITCSLSELEQHQENFKSGQYLPVGTVEFVREAMRLSGIAEPTNISYPSVLRGFLKRKLEERQAGSIFQAFVKPINTKTFTGFVFDAMMDPDSLDQFTAEQFHEFMKLDAREKVWTSEIVEWNAEVRYYVLEGKILGYGRYDDGPDEWPEPPLEFVQEIVDTYESRSMNTPIAYSVDVGMLASGEPALVECNDAWALGCYKGTLSENDYVEMLWARWQQLFSQRV